MASPNVRPLRDVHSGQPAEDRRRQSRLDVLDQCLAPVKLGENNGGIALNLSPGGMTVQAIAPLAVGQSCAIELRLPNTSFALTGRGEVVSSWQKAIGLRVQFSPESQVWLRRWLELNGWAAPASEASIQVPAVTAAMPVRPPTLRVLTAPAFTRRRTNHYAALVVAALLSGVMVLALAIRNGTGRNEPVSASHTPAFTPTPSTVPPTFTSVETPPEPPKIQAPQARVQRKPKVQPAPRRSVEEEEPEVVVRNFVNGRWVVVKRSEP